MAVTSSGRIQVDIKYRGQDDTKKASQSAAKNIDRTRKSAKKAGKEIEDAGKKGSKGFLGLERGVVAVADTLGILSQGASAFTGMIGGLIASASEAAANIARLEFAFGGLDEGMMKAAQTGHQIGLDALGRMATTAKLAGVEINFTAQQIETIGKMATVMGIDSDKGFQMVTKAIADAEPAALKQLGIFIDTTEAQKAYAKQQGITQETMGHTDRQAAALNAVMKELNRTVVSGGAAFGKLDHAQRQAGDVLSLLKAKFLVPIAEKLASNVIFLLEEVGIQGRNAGIKIGEGFMQADRAFENTLLDISRISGGFDEIQGRIHKLRTDAALGDPNLPGFSKNVIKHAKSVFSMKAKIVAQEGKLQSIQLKRSKLAKHIADMTGEVKGHLSFNVAMFEKLKGLTQKTREELILMIHNAKDLPKHLQFLSRFQTKRRWFPGVHHDLDRLARVLGEGLHQIAEENKILITQQGALLEKEEALAGTMKIQKGLKAELTAQQEKLLILVKRMFIDEEQIERLTRSRLARSLAAERAILGLLTNKSMILVGIGNKNRLIFNTKKAIFEMERKAAVAKIREDLDRIKRDGMELRVLRAKARVRYEQLTGKSVATGRKGYAGQLDQWEGWKKAGVMTPSMKQQYAILLAQAAAAKSAYAAYSSVIGTNAAAQSSVMKQLEMWSKVQFKAPRGRGGARKKEPAFKAPSIEDVDRAKNLLTVLKAYEGIERATSDEEKKRTTRAKIALAIKTVELEVTRSLQKLSATSAEMEEGILKIKKRRKLTAKEISDIEIARGKIQAARLGHLINEESRLQFLRAKELALITAIDEAARKRFLEKLKALRSELAIESVLAAARADHIRYLARIHELKKKGLKDDEATTLNLQAQFKLREAMFDTWAQNTQGAITMGLRMDEIVRKYAEMSAKSKESGDVSLMTSQKFVKSTAMLLQAVNSQSKQINKTINAFQGASKQGALGYMKATTSAIAVGGQLAASIVEDEKTKAAILGVSELAASFASYPDPVGIASHAMASAMYFAIAGTAGKGSVAGSETTPTQVTADGGTSEEMSPGTTIININAPVIGGSDQEIGKKLGEWLGGNAGSGFGG